MPGQKTRTVAVLLAAAFAAFSMGNAYAAGEVTLRLENADIQELIRWGAEHTGKNIILPPQVKGQVTVLAGAIGRAHARPAGSPWRAPTEIVGACRGRACAPRGLAVASPYGNCRRL